MLLQSIGFILHCKIDFSQYSLKTVFCYQLFFNTLIPKINLVGRSKINNKDTKNYKCHSNTTTNSLPTPQKKKIPYSKTCSNADFSGGYE